MDYDMDELEKKQVLQQILVPAEQQPIIEVSEEKQNNKQLAQMDAEVVEDAEAARNGMYELLEQGTSAIVNLQRISSETMHPRAFEVLNQLLKTQSETLEKLLKLQKDKRNLVEKSPTNNLNQSGTAQPIHVEQAVFVGSTADLMKNIRQEKSGE